MREQEVQALQTLDAEGILDKKIVVWGLNGASKELIEYLEVQGKKITYVLDNFKDVSYRHYCKIPVCHPRVLREMAGEYVILLNNNFAAEIQKQLYYYGIRNVYNLHDLKMRYLPTETGIKHEFEKRSNNCSTLCYILAGYQDYLWDNVFERIKRFAGKDIDYCIVSSGIYSERLAQIARENDWSYLWTDTNQVAYIQNLVIELHPLAKRILKMDEDIFVPEGFFDAMEKAMDEAEQFGEYRIGFLAPIVPLNCCGYVSYLNISGNKEEFAKCFGRAYRHHYAGVCEEAKAAVWLWESCGNFDRMAKKIALNQGFETYNCYYNIGCIMYTRERWILMGTWPVEVGSTGMGQDEVHLIEDNQKKDMVIYEAQNILVGHFAFGSQKDSMRRLYEKKPEIFSIM